MAWKVTQTVPTLAVPDLGAGTAYYERLGFTHVWDFPREAPTHRGMERDGFEIMLCHCEPAVTGEMTFVVDDIDACHAQILDGRAWELAAEAGALAERGDCPPKAALLPPQPPVDQPYGYREFTLVDPWGHMHHFAQAIDATRDE